MTSDLTLVRRQSVPTAVADCDSCADRTTSPARPPGQPRSYGSQAVRRWAAAHARHNPGHLVFVTVERLDTYGMEPRR